MNGKQMLAVVAGSLLSAGLLAGCNGAEAEDPGIATVSGKGASVAPSASSPALDEGERQLKFTKCMRDNGVDMPDPEPGDRGGTRVRVQSDADAEKVDAALEACKQYQPNGGEPIQLDPAQVEQVRKMAQCMRENGVPEFPDPDANGRVTFKRKQGAGADEETLRAAGEKCKQYQPSPRASR